MGFEKSNDLDNRLSDDLEIMDLTDESSTGINNILSILNNTEENIFNKPTHDNISDIFSNLDGLSPERFSINSPDIKLHKELNSDFCNMSNISSQTSDQIVTINENINENIISPEIAVPSSSSSNNYKHIASWVESTIVPDFSDTNLIYMETTNHQENMENSNSLLTDLPITIDSNLPITMDSNFNNYKLEF